MFQGPNIALNFVLQAPNCTCPKGRFGTFSYLLQFAFGLDKGQTRGELMHRFEPHLQARGNISAMITAGGIKQLVGHASTGINHEQIAMGHTLLCTYHGS